MSVFTFKLPDIGEGIAEAEIAEWKVGVGDAVVEDQALCDMLTDKAAVEIPSPVAGTIKELRGEPGDRVAVGAPLILIDADGPVSAPDDAPSQPAPAPEAPAQAQPAGPAPESAPTPAPEAPPAAKRHTRTAPATITPTAPDRTARRPRRHQAKGPGDKPLASPAVRRRAREMGIDLSRITGSGPGGRIVHDDLDAPRAGLSGAAQNAREARHGVEQIKVIGVRRAIADAMQRSKQRIPHFAYVEECDVTELERLRQHLNATRRPDQAKLTVLPFLMQALVRVAPDFPQVNANFDDEAGILHRIAALHVGIAAQTEQGLMVPVVRHAETLDIWGMAAELQRLAEAARSGRASRDELRGSSITISSLGPLGGIASTPVINAPEVAIVGVNKMVERPVFQNGAVVPRMLMNLSSSFDHRIVDGWDAAAFIQAIKTHLEHPATLFL